MRQAVQTGDAPAAIGPYSQAVVAGSWVFTAGQVGLDPRTGEMVGPDVREQTEQVLRNLQAVLTAAGVSFENVVKTTIFLQDMGDFAAVNEIYGRVMPTPPPARSTVAVAGLPRGARVEIECIALR